MLCVFLRGVGIVGVTATQDVKVDPQGHHDSRHEKERGLDVRDAGTSDA
jgi:hypothetical protein